ncbi:MULTISPECIES: nuclear transport factor 2 family protein [Asticcacaulis]|uniref:nuclear transport factor 2 family protein n=1 Tax=Asticcacaulis TaxID=76890 RepID=UPI001AE56083|nr:nuclear transport factor 2 family protein [Asticcacaulis sp. BE141]MBP2160410.1 ketosteroid isomerase-like protein [Asticcacaulis solisilvae]MDR6801287.1 ketosteroid isomerase-like protein [Asticcacaulis sp. BE141]
MLTIDPKTFAESWCAAWNARDIEAVLAHFHDDATFTSPFARRIWPDSPGVFSGKPAIRAYWTEGLKMVPDLHFRIETVFSGVDTVVIHYVNQAGRHVAEVLTFQGDKVISGHGTYAG